MPEVINIRKGKTILFSLDKDVFELLFNHTIARRRTKYTSALTDRQMQYDDFIALAISAEVPYPLFFMSKKDAKAVILEYEKKVYFGVGKLQMSIASRGDIVLADISLVLKDITRKQSFIKKYIDSNNDVPGRFKKKKLSVAEHASELRALLGYDLSRVEDTNKENSFELLSKGLASQNVFVSLYAHNYTPQSIEKELQFSGIAINDRKCPFLFVKAGDNDSRIEPWGRRLFTVALLLSSLCWGDCGPLTMDGKSGELTDDRHFLFAEEFLMPESLFKDEAIKSYSDVHDIASKYSVSASAVVMRSFRLNMIDESTKDEYLQRLLDEWDKIVKDKGGGRQIGLEKAINRYNNPAVVQLILEKQRAGDINKNEAKNLLCYKKGDTFNLGALEHNA